MKRIGAVLGILALAGTLGATETRVWTYAQGNVAFLMDDELVIRLYPGQIFNFGKFVTVENPVVPGLNPAGVYQYASIFYANETYGIGIYPGTRVDVTAGTGVLTVYPLHTVVGFNAGAMKLGLRFAVGYASLNDYSATVIGFRPGITMNLGYNSGLDMALCFNYRGGTDGTNSSSTVTFGFNGRYYGAVVVPVNAQVVRSDNTTVVNLGLGVGNNVDLGVGKTLVAGLLNYNNLGGKNFGLGTLLGGEFKVWRGLILRGSLSYNLLVYSDDGTNKLFDFGVVGPFTLGAGYDLGFARVDLALSTDLITNGPYFLTGNPNSEIVTMLSILGKF